MKVGTRSVLYGYHCLLLHWLFVARGWYRLNGFRRIYIGERKMTRREQLEREATMRVSRGYFHDWTLPVYASLWNPRLWLAFVAHDIGYWGKPNMDGAEGEAHPEVGAQWMRERFGEPWGFFCLYHSRFYAKRDGGKPSALCYADKVAFLAYPTWLIVLLVTLTGEAKEYMANYARDNAGVPPYRDTRTWAEGVKTFVRRWVEEHKDGAEDRVTIIREH